MSRDNEPLLAKLDPSNNSAIAMDERKALAERIHARLEKFREQFGTLSDSTQLIREDRDARG